jgi:hypothetical protein
MTIRPLYYLLALLACLAFTGCPTSGGDDDDSAGDDDDATGDDDDATGDDDDATGDDDDATGDDDDSAGDDDDDSAGDDDDDTPATFEPAAGLFDYGLIYYSLNECNGDQSVVGSGATLVSLDTTGETFTWDYVAEGDPDASCFYDQTQNFVCNNTQIGSSLSPIGIQATVNVTTTASGTFSSPTVSEFAISKTITCSGSQCSIAASAFGVSGFPCTATFTTTGTNTD